ncbi:zinc-binding alcohol dehydrogenase family protein [Dactylosporangium sp. NPDC005572]|uniref:quinone oxidoreductase family protein n=1 Tax=Dactylosporangium sp. NPDC005572 TaxID=3156889 RepID=UPI0033B92F24
MLAAVVHALGAEPVVEEFPDPGSANDVAEVVAAALNPVDIIIAAGQMPFRRLDPPFVAGIEGVARLGDGSHRYFSAPRAPYGSLAELVSLAGAETAPVPTGLDPIVAATLGVSGLAAWLSLTATGGLKAGENVLILGAEGQVGSIAVQLARLQGAARVVGVVRDAATRQASLDKGADEVVSFTDAGNDLAQQLRQAAPDGVDLILDLVWGPTVAPAIQVARQGARVVQIGNSGGTAATLSAPALRNSLVRLLPHSNFAFTADERSTAFEQLAAHAASGALSVDVERVPLADATAAWRRLVAGNAPRKLVVTPPAAGGRF